MRKIEVPTYTPTEFELGDTVADLQRKRKERSARDREEEAQKHRRGCQEEGMKEETTHTAWREW